MRKLKRTRMIDDPGSTNYLQAPISGKRVNSPGEP